MKKDKKYRRVVYLMNKYHYQSKIKHPKQIFREYRLAKLLSNKKIKPLKTFGDLTVGSVEHNERLEVFKYFESLGYSESKISSIWRSTQDNKRKRQRNRII